MFHEAVPDPGDRSPAELERAFADRLAAVIAARGVDGVVAETDLPEGTIEAAREGDLEDLTLEAGGAILALSADTPSAGEVVALSRDALLMGMSNAVMDVDALASALDDVMEPREIQQKVEGRQPMTLAEYALLYHQVESRY